MRVSQGDIFSKFTPTHRSKMPATLPKPFPLTPCPAPVANPPAAVRRLPKGLSTTIITLDPRAVPHPFGQTPS
jgi:hypothetical protein